MSLIDKQLEQMQELLEGFNYTVFFGVYVSKLNETSSPTTVVLDCFPDATLGKIVSSNTISVLRQFDHDVLHRGDSSHGPDPVNIDSDEFKSLFASVRGSLKASCEAADLIHEFRLRDGHPALPVFWDFSFLLQFADRSIIWMGSSSD